MAALNPETLSHLLSYPIQAPPPGVMPNFVNPDSIAYQVYITGAVCIPVMIVFALATLLHKLYLGKQTVLSHDIAFSAGLVLCIASIGIAVATVAGGSFGMQAYNVRLGDFTKWQLVLCLLNEIFQPIALGLVKASLLMLYIRLFEVMRWVRITSLVGVIVIMAFHVSVSISFAAMCSPRTGDGQLDFLAAFISESCSQTRVIVLVQGVVGLATDIFILVIPLPVIWTLNMSFRRKVGISSMFLVGLCGCISSIIGLYYRYQYYSAGQDNIRLVVPTHVTAFAEMAAGVMICCMPSVAAVCRSFKTPLLSGLSSARDRLLNITGTGGGGLFRSRAPATGKSSPGNENKKDRKGSSSSQNPIYNNPDPYYFTTGVETHSLQELGTCTNNGIEKQTEVRIWRGGM